MSNNNGYIKLHRKILDNPVVFRDSDHFAVWVYLLLKATHSGCDVMFGGKRIHLHPGQLTTGRKKIAEDTKVSESKVQRILKRFEIEHQIEQRTDRQCRLISIVAWDKYQAGEQRNEQRVNNDRTTSEQRVNTKQECKKEKKGKNDSSYDLAPDNEQGMNHSPYNAESRRRKIAELSEQVLKEIEQ